MSFEVHADLVPLFRGLVTGLQPFATAQQVELGFEAKVENLFASYNPAEALSEITVLLSRIIAFIPQSYKVMVSVEKCNEHGEGCLLRIRNTGVDLSKLGEILSSVSEGLSVERLEKGTCFIVEIPINQVESKSLKTGQKQSLLPKQYPMYHSVMNRRLFNHFANSKHLEEAASKRNINEGVFLKKINAVIKSRMDDSDFKVDQLADAVALSRTQLFRKLKRLTQMSPQKYLRFVRLETAKKLLQSNDRELNVSEVCYKVGFASKSHFTRSFQKEFGFNPSSFK